MTTTTIYDRDERIAELIRIWEENTGDTASDYDLSIDDYRFGMSDAEANELEELLEQRDEGRTFPTHAKFRTLTDEIRAMLLASTEIGTRHRARTRLRLTFAAFYDDASDDPSQAIRDLLTDIHHEAEGRGLDFITQADRAAWAYRQERDEWKERARS